jgi:hypothetical protein
MRAWLGDVKSFFLRGLFSILALEIGDSSISFFSVLLLCSRPIAY